MKQYLELETNVYIVETEKGVKEVKALHPTIGMSYQQSSNVLPALIIFNPDVRALMFVSLNEEVVGSHISFLDMMFNLMSSKDSRKDLLLNNLDLLKDEDPLNNPILVAVLPGVDLNIRIYVHNPLALINLDKFVGLNPTEDTRKGLEDNLNNYPVSHSIHNFNKINSVDANNYPLIIKMKLGMNIHYQIDESLSVTRALRNLKTQDVVGYC